MKSDRKELKLDVAAVAHARPALLPDNFAPQLALPADSVPSGRVWLYETRHEGVRMLARVEGAGVRFLGGAAEQCRLPGLENELANIAAETVLLDGQLLALQPDGTSSLRKLQDLVAAGRTAPLVYGSFDLLYLDGYDLTDVELATRKQLLRGLLTCENTAAHRGSLRYVHHFEGDGQALYTEICRLSLPGMVCKRRTSRYRSGPSAEWLEVRAKAAFRARGEGSSIPGLGANDHPRLVARGIVRSHRKGTGTNLHDGKN